MLRSRAARDDLEAAVTAVITASRWNAIDPDYKTGRPSDGTAGILRLTTDRGTVLVPAEIVDRHRLFALGPLVATPGALRALVREGTDPARLLSRHGTGDWGTLTPMTTTPTTRPSAAVSGSSAPTTSDPLAFGSSLTPTPTAPSAAPACAPATPPPSCCPPNTDPTESHGAGRHRGTTGADAG